MKKHFAEMYFFWDQSLQAKGRVRGFDLYVKELLRSLTRAFDPDTRTVYVSGYAFPVELLWAFDVVPFDFEIACNNLPAATGGQGSHLMKVAENQGFSQDICSFDRLILACHLQGDLPPGDLYLTSSYFCQSKAKANEIVARAHQKENVLFDVPNEISPASRRYVATQLQEIAARLEAVTGQPLDLERLKEAIRRSNRARARWQELLELMKHRPCPWDGVRACLLSLGGAIFWGSSVMEEILTLLVGEIKNRIAAGAAFPEKYRILWFPWVPVQTTNIFSTLKDHQASIPMAEVAQLWWSELDEDRPFEALAQKALEHYLVGPAEKRVRNIVHLAREYQVDGAIHFSTPACHHENGAFRLISDAFKETGLPVLDLDGDMTDELKYSPKRTLEKLTYFMEMLEAGRGRVT